MKPKFISSLIALGLGSTAFAGETTATSSYTAPPSEAPSLWTWFIGGSAGYLIDSEEEFYTIHLGMKIAESGPVTHSLTIEGAYTDLSTLGLDTEIIPVTLNYKLDYNFTESLSFYAGVGAGAAFVDSEFFGLNDDSVELTAQVFAGFGYDVTTNFQLYTGARWVWVDESEFAGSPIDIGTDVGLELGMRFKF